MRWEEEKLEQLLLPPMCDHVALQVFQKKRGIVESTLLNAEAAASCLAALGFGLLYSSQFEAFINNKVIPYSSVYQPELYKSTGLFPHPMESGLCLSLLSLTVSVVRAVITGLDYLPRIVCFVYDGVLAALWYVVFLAMFLDLVDNPMTSEHRGHWGGILVIVPLLGLYIYRIETSISQWREELELQARIRESTGIERYSTEEDDMD